MINLSGSHLLKMTSSQVVETSVKVTPNSPSQDYSHPDDHNFRTYDMTPGFKPFTVLKLIFIRKCLHFSPTFIMRFTATGKMATKTATSLFLSYSHL